VSRWFLSILERGGRTQRTEGERLTRRRLDAELVRRGLAESRGRARDAVLDGKVLVSGSVATKPERMVDDAEPIEFVGDRPRFVSRGGEKLDPVLDAFAIDVAGWRCLDVGSSTGGFTDCLLQRGALAVVALDVGRGQLAWSLRQDERVTVLERTDVRDVDPAAIGAVDLVVADVSFISLRTVLEPIATLARGAPIVALVKPQFEVGKGRVGKGGIVRDPQLHEEAVAGVVEKAASLGLGCAATMPSPVPGTEGNVEFFVLLRPETAA
jgi:23S rRNA (cytidine1920-2'-O)/16S rRNA (cytidine1409-2'-O)-methyltransferase